MSLPVQHEKLDLYCRAYDHDLIEVIPDNGESAKTLERPGIIRARELLRSGRAEALLIAKLDRLTRSLVDWAELIEEHFGDRRPSKLISVQDHIDTATATGRMMLNLIVM